MEIAHRRWPGAALDLRVDRDNVRSRTVLLHGTLIVNGDPTRIVVKARRSSDGPGRTTESTPGTAPVPMTPSAAAGPQGAPRVDAGRPRLAPYPDARLRIDLEADALRLVHTDLTHSPDPRFRSIDVIGVMEARPGFVMTEAEGRPLRSLLNRSPLPGGPSSADGLERAFASAGAWLRRYHGLAPEVGQPRQASVEEVVDLATRLADWLSERAGGAGRDGAVARFQAVAALFRRDAPGILSDPLELGLGHGDFAPRNILVLPGGVITVVDMWTRWRPPILEDLATFLGVIRTSMVQVVSGDRWLSASRLERLERAFIGGYFEGERPPFAALHLYQLLLLLDRWGGIPGIADPARGSGRAIAPMRWRRYSAEADRLLRLLGSPAGDRGAATTERSSDAVGRR